MKSKQLKVFVWLQGYIYFFSVLFNQITFYLKITIYLIFLRREKHLAKQAQASQEHSKLKPGFYQAP